MGLGKEEKGHLLVVVVVGGGRGRLGDADARPLCWVWGRGLGGGVGAMAKSARAFLPWPRNVGAFACPAGGGIGAPIPPRKPQPTPPHPKIVVVGIVLIARIIQKGFPRIGGLGGSWICCELRALHLNSLSTFKKARCTGFGFIIKGTERQQFFFFFKIAMWRCIFQWGTRAQNPQACFILLVFF